MPAIGNGSSGIAEIACIFLQTSLALRMHRTCSLCGRGRGGRAENRLRTRYSPISTALRKVSNSRSDTRSLPFEASPLSSWNVHESSFIPNSPTASLSSRIKLSPRDYSLTQCIVYCLSLSLSHTQLLPIHRNHIIERMFDFV